MKYQDYVNTIARNGVFESTEHADDALMATLEVLGVRLSGDEAAQLAEQLPLELQAPLTRNPGDAEPLDVEEFLERVSAQEGRGCPIEQPRQHVHTVLSTVADSVSGGEMEDVREQLPPEYVYLLSNTPREH